MTNHRIHNRLRNLSARKNFGGCCSCYNSTLQSDNSGEYTSHAFQMYLLDNNIKHQTITPYNLQQNGVTERMNRTLLNMVRLMMFFKIIKLMFWGEAMPCASYICNHCPSSIIHNKSPCEKWYNQLHVVKHFRVLVLYVMH